MKKVFEKSKSILKGFEKKLPRTYLAFPISDSDSENADLGAPKQRGVALMIAMLVVAMCMGFAADMIITSSVSVQMSIATRDKVKAEYMAKSGINLSLFLLSIDWGIDLFMAQQKQKPTDGLGDIWAMLNGMPIGGSTLEMITSTQEEFGLSKVMDEDVLTQLELFDGRFIPEISDESSKININYCGKGRCTQVLLMLEALFSCPVEKAFLAEKKLTPKEMAFRIKDFIDDNIRNEPESGFNDEDDPYQDKIPSYKAKNAPLDTLDELKLIEGWDDEMHAVFAPYLTLYPFQLSGTQVSKLNINTMDRGMLACLVHEGLDDDCRSKFEIGFAEISKDAGNIHDSGKMSNTLKNLMCYSSSEGEYKAGDAKDKSNWFKGSSDVYKIVVIGEVGDQERTLTSVIQRLDSAKIKKKKFDDRSYDIHYWKLL